MLDSVMLWLSNWGLVIPILCVLLTRDRKTILAALISFVLAYGISDALKIAVSRPRPFVVGDAQMIGPAPCDAWSFPSKHASASFSIATSAFLNKRVLGWIALVSAGLISYSRVYLGVHYWSDVIAGAIIGSAISSGVQYGMMRFERKRKKS